MTEDQLYEEIWEWIKEIQSSYKSPEVVKIMATLWALSERLINQDPNQISLLLKKLVASGRVETNLFEENVFPFDAYILPTNFNQDNDTKSGKVKKSNYQLYTT